jgi:hypothetical protein
MNPTNFPKTMASPDIDSSILKTVIDWAWTGVVALGGLVWKNQNDRLDSVRAELRAHKLETDTDIRHQRDISAKIFDKLDDLKDDANNKHLELLNALHAGLARKVDK